MYLIIDTSTRYGAVALWRDGVLARAAEWHSEHSHTAELMPSIDTLFSQAGESVEGLRGIALAIGPGGFSTLRAGMGVAKGLSFATGVPLVGVSSLEASAYPYRRAGYPVCALLEAGRDLVAWARFQQVGETWRRRTPDRVTPVEVLLQARGRHTLFCGEGVAAYTARLQDALGQRAHMVYQPFPLDRLQGVAALGVARLEAGESDPVAGLQPRYLRPPGITQPRPARAVRYGASASR